MVKWVFLSLIIATRATADPIVDLMTTARASFDRMPDLQTVDEIIGHCGANAQVNPSIVYCTTTNTIFLSEVAAAAPQAAYLVAHELGHAVQVQHGIADVALREINRRRGEEPILRGYVARQVDCVAGFLMAQAGLPQAELKDWFSDEPFAGTHWGRDPLSVGPQVQIGLAERDIWFQRGQSAETMADCAAGEFGAELLLRAYKG